MTNDVLAEKLSAINERAAADFAERFGSVLLRVAHETVALRRQVSTITALEQGEEAARELKETAWTEAVRSLRPYTQRIREESAE